MSDPKKIVAVKNDSDGNVAAVKLTSISESKDPSIEEMQQQIKDLTSMLSEVMYFLDNDLATRLQDELKLKHDGRS